MVFKRRAPRSWLRLMADSVWPKGGWRRAASYVGHRLRRLPDAPERVGRGVFAGIFVSFTPFFGFHSLLAVLLALALRGNIIAALLATFIGNPLTFPLIMTVSVELGSLILGSPHDMQMQQVAAAFTRASVELWANVQAIFRSGPVHWGGLEAFFRRVFLPYLVGGIVPGLITGGFGYWASLLLIEAYRRHRRNRMQDGFARRLSVSAEVLEEIEARAWADMQEAAGAGEPPREGPQQGKGPERGGPQPPAPPASGGARSP